MLGGALAVLQAPMFDGLSLDPFSLFDDVAGPAEVGVSGRHVLQALVVTPVIVVFDERLDLGFEVTGPEVVFQQDAVLHGLVPALRCLTAVCLQTARRDLALRLGMERRTAHMDHTLGFDVFSQLAGDVAGSIVRQQARSVMHVGRRTARGNQRKIQRIGDVLGPHRAAQLPGDDVARVIVEHGRQVHPAPPDDLEVGEVGLPHLVHPRGLGVEAIRRLDHHIGRAGDQVMGFQQAVNRRFRHEVALLVGKPHGQLPGRQLGLIQRHPGCQNPTEGSPQATLLSIAAATLERPFPIFLS